MRKEDSVKILFILGMIVTIFLLLIININRVSADGNLGTFKKGDTISLSQICDSCTYVKLISITLPNGTTLNLNQNMTNYNQFFNYSFDGTDKEGEYTYSVCGDKGGSLKCENLNFKITYTGEEFSNSKSILYFILLIFLLLLMIACLYFTFRLPLGNNRGDDGLIFSVNNLKYAKVGLMVLSYGLFVSLLFILSNISLAYLGNELIGRFFFTIYTIFMRMMYLVILIAFLWSIVMVFKDNQLKKMLQRGYEIK